MNIAFKHQKNGLYYYDTCIPIVTSVKTTEGNKEGYTK